jgi:hypothetical protein
VLLKIIGHISDIETIASGRGIRERRRLRKIYGGQRWRKLKGTAGVKFADVRYAMPNCTGMKRTALAQENSKVKRILEIQ